MIHAVGPDFREVECDEEGAVEYLAHTYANVFREALRGYQQFPDVSKLRLLPISSGVFVGNFTKEQMARIAARAIEGALKSLTRKKLSDLADLEIKMCIFEPDQVGLYRKSMEALSKGYVRRAEPPEPLPEIDGGSQKGRGRKASPRTGPAMRKTRKSLKLRAS